MEEGKGIGGFAGSPEVVRTLDLQVQEPGRGVGVTLGPHQERKLGLPNSTTVLLHHLDFRVKRLGPVPCFLGFFEQNHCVGHRPYIFT